MSKTEFTQDEVREAVARVFGCEAYEVETPPPDSQAFYPQMVSFVRNYSEPGSCGCEYCAYVSAETVGEILAHRSGGRFVFDGYTWQCKLVFD